MGKIKSKRGGGQQRQRIIVVVGMHRSGTSVLTRGLQSLGVHLGTGFLTPDAHNPKGYWENPAIVQLQDDLLAAQGMTWDSACAFPKTVANLEEFRQRARDLIQSVAGGTPLFGFKDPRTARLLWFWQPVFEELELQDSYVMNVRNPGDVIASLQARQDMPWIQGLLLWAFHYLDALAGTEGRDRVMVDYDDLLTQPAFGLRRIAEGLALPLDATTSEAIENDSREIVVPDLRHYLNSNVAWDREPVSRSVLELYRMLRSVVRGEMTLESAAAANAIEAVRIFTASTAPKFERAARGGEPAMSDTRGKSQGTWEARLDPRMPAALSVSERTHIEVICTNEGSRPWPPERPEGPHLALSYHVRSPSGVTLVWDGARTPITHEVQPGQQVRLQADFTAPDHAGDYLIEWDMVIESECWFQDTGSFTVVAPLRVTKPDRVERGRYPVQFIPVSSWAPRFQRAIKDIRVAIAVRTWNVIRYGRRECFEKTLDSLGEAGHPFELFLMDNGSTDGTAELVSQRGGYAAPRVGEHNEAGYGMNIAIERALSSRPDLVVFSDDDFEWQPGFLRRIVEFWASAPNDFGLLGGYLEPRWPWNAISEALDCGQIRAVVRESAPGGAWTFPAAHWRWIGPLPLGMGADYEACLRLRRMGFRIAQADLAKHIGATHSTWGNAPPRGKAVSEKLFRHSSQALGSIADKSIQYKAFKKAIGERDTQLDRFSQALVSHELKLADRDRIEAALQAEIARLNQVLAERERDYGAELQAQRQIAQQFESDWRSSKDRVSELGAQLAELGIQLDTDRAENLRLTRELAERNARLSAMLNSLSWRLMAPARHVNYWLLRILGLQHISIYASAPLNLPAPAALREHVAQSPSGIAMSNTLLKFKPSSVHRYLVEDFLTFDDEAFIEAAYLGVLGRPPDPPGFEHFIGRLRTGATKVDILRDMTSSPEGRLAGARIAGLEFRYRVTRISRRPVLGALIRILFRPILLANTKAYCRVRDISAFYDEEFIGAAYRAVLRRPPDPIGYEFYLGMLRSGIDKIEIIGSLRYSKEGSALGTIVDGLSPISWKILRLVRWPLVGPVLGFFLALFQLPEIQREQRIIENYLMSILLTDRIRVNSPKAAHMTAASRVVGELSGSVFDNLSRRAAGVLVDLKRAIRQQ